MNKTPHQGCKLLPFTSSIIPKISSIVKGKEFEKTIAKKEEKG
jgi:hypothetical protein